MKERDLVYDFCWFPGMNSAVPASCCLLATSRRHSIQLWDAYSGDVRCIYKPINHLVSDQLRLNRIPPDRLSVPLASEPQDHSCLLPPDIN